MNKNLILLTTFIILTLNSFGQKPYRKIIINDSLFNETGDRYGFSIVKGQIVSGINNEDIQDINDVIKIDNDSIKFRINFGCGCGGSDIKLVTDGLLHKDQYERDYYKIKLHFTNYNQGCKAFCQFMCSFDISELKNQQNEIYIKYEDFDHLIKYK